MCTPLEQHLNSLLVIRFIRVAGITVSEFFHVGVSVIVRRCCDVSTLGIPDPSVEYVHATGARSNGPRSISNISSRYRSISSISASSTVNIRGLFELTITTVPSSKTISPGLSSSGFTPSFSYSVSVESFQSHSTTGFSFRFRSSSLAHARKLS